jgi:hypothetical protein
MLKLRHVQTQDAPEPCVLNCGRSTTYRAMMMIIEKPLCPECATSIVDAAQLLARIASTIKTNTHTKEIPK